MNIQAEELNKTIKNDSPAVYELLSVKGQEIFFPKSGILAQSAAAKGKKINATIGQAIEDNGKAMCLSGIARNISIPTDQAVSYAPSYGRPELRKAWKDMLYKKNPGLAGKNISLPVASCGITHALNVAGFLFLNEGAEVLVPDLYWGNYNLIFKHWHNVKITNYKLFKNEGMDLDAIESALSGSGRKISLLMNFPNNPSGYTPTIQESHKIAELIKSSAEKGNKILVMLDDAYFGLVFEENIYTESLFSLLADIHENVLTLKMDGATKEDYVWGFRVGFMTYATKNNSDALYSALEAKTAGAIRGNISNIANISQSLLLDAYQAEDYDKEKQEKYDILEKRYHKVKQVLAQKKEYLEYFHAIPFNSGYFMCIQLKEGLDTQKIWQTLLDKYDTGVIHLSGIFRIAFSAIPETMIEEMFDNIYAAILDSLKV